MNTFIRKYHELNVVFQSFLCWRQRLNGQSDCVQTSYDNYLSIQLDGLDRGKAKLDTGYKMALKNMFLI